MNTIASRSTGIPAHAHLQCGITRSGTTVTITTYVQHGLSIGSRFVISGADQTEYNGQFEAATVPDGYTVTVETDKTPTTPATGLPNLLVLTPFERVRELSVEVRSGRLQVNDALAFPNGRVSTEITQNVSGSVVALSSVSIHAETQFVLLSVGDNNVRYTVNGSNPTATTMHAYPAGTTIQIPAETFRRMKVISETGTAKLFISQLIVL